MSRIQKTEAIVLSKLNYSDTSKIAHFYTKDFGKISGILKGGRTKNSKIGAMVDPLNILEIVFYQKENRDIQIVTNAELIAFHPLIKENFEKLKFSYAIIELVNFLTIESEVNLRLFSGIKKILQNMNSTDENPALNYLRFFVFLMHESGFELQLNLCSECDNEIKSFDVNGFNYEKGILCPNCSQDHLISLKLSRELFDLLICLKSGKKILSYDEMLIKSAIKFSENYLQHHHHEYKGSQSLKLE
ncbi:MAG: DNA repair protein RecO [Ignavibacteria bacterium]|jgi:DNA repair protein RecO (recombination protein O)|nr:DNA repair protein RecO [Ignavibacteria bacterium]